MTHKQLAGEVFLSQISQI